MRDLLTRLLQSYFPEKLSVALAVAEPLAWLALLAGLYYALANRLFGRAKALLNIATAVVGAGLLVLLAGGIGEVLPQMGSNSAHARACDVMKVFISLGAAGFVFFEIHRMGQKRPVAERWQKLVLISLAVASIVVYFQSFRFGYPRFYHRWDQYHYYMGAKYFPEIGYDGLYKCTAIAQDELGDGVELQVFGQTRKFDFRKEVRKPDKKIRNLSGDNLLVKADEILADPDQCRSRFSPQRWEQYKSDVAFFGSQCFLDGYWTQMQHDHGYNPPPVWTLGGSWLANLHGPGLLFELGGQQYVFAQVIAMIDVVYILGALALIWWAFGWRIFAVAAIFWGCQSSAPAYWTLGAMLRQDWLFFFVGAVCFARKRYFALAGASMVYAALLRIFPGLAVVGWLIVAGIHLVRHKRMKAEHVRALIGGTVAAVVLMGGSMAVVGKDSYQKFYHHTIQVHDQTPLTNHMGLRVLVGHDIGDAFVEPVAQFLQRRAPGPLKRLAQSYDLDAGKASGRMKYTKDVKETDPFKIWKQMRLDRYRDYRATAYSLIGITLLASILLLRRIKSLWVAQCLSQVWIILLSQLTCYYYSFMIISAPLTRLRRDMEIWLFGFAGVSQFIWKIFGYNDDKYTLLTLLSLVLCYAMMFSFGKRDEPTDRPASWLDLSGPKLAALVAFVPGVVMIGNAAVLRDWSTVGVGLLAVYAGYWLWGWGKRQASLAAAQSKQSA